MTRLSIQLDLPDDEVDPTLEDPVDIAEAIIGQWQEWASVNASFTVEVAAAEWET